MPQELEKCGSESKKGRDAKSVTELGGGKKEPENVRIVAHTCRLSGSKRNIRDGDQQLEQKKS